MEVAAVACLSLFGMGVMGFGYSVKQVRQAHRKAKWTDPRSVTPLESTARKFKLINAVVGENRLPTVQIIDEEGKICFLIDHANFYSSVWYLKDATSLENVAIIHVSPVGTYFTLENDGRKVVCASRESGRFREFQQSKDGITTTYRWYSQSYHLERVVVQPGSCDEATILHEIVGNCRRLDTKHPAFEFNFDTQRVDIISGIASGYINMMTDWRKVKKRAKAQASKDMERDESISRFKKIIGWTKNYQNIPPDVAQQIIRQEYNTPNEMPLRMPAISVPRQPNITVNVNNGDYSQPAVPPHRNLPEPPSDRSNAPPIPPIADMSDAFADFFNESEEMEEERDQEGDAFCYPQPQTRAGNSTNDYSNPRIRPLSNSCTPTLTMPSQLGATSESAVLFPRIIRRPPLKYTAPETLQRPACL